MVTDVYIIVLPAAALCVPKVIIFTRSFPKHEKNHEARSQLVCCLEQHEKRLQNLLACCLIINHQSSSKMRLRTERQNFASCGF